MKLNLKGHLLLNLSSLAALALTVLVGAACAQPKNQYKLYADGLACPFCAYGIEKELSAIKGVEKIDIDIGQGLIRVTMADGARLEEAVARKAVKDAGFTLRSFEKVSPAQ
jgi:mercuric ion binding protein